MIKDGDIFRWRYKDEKPAHLGAFNRYHCKSQIAIAHDGALYDTFWHGRGSSTDTNWSCEEAERALDLILMGNLGDLESRPEYHAMYYDDADIVDINHANSSSGNFYIRKGAKRSRDKMRSVVAERITARERDLERAQMSLDQNRIVLALIDKGENIDTMDL